MLGARFIENIEDCLQKDLPFALYRLPNTDELILMVSKSGVDVCCFEDLKEKTEGFVFHPFKQTEENPILFISADIVLSSKDGEWPKFDIANDVTVSGNSSVEISKDISEYDYLEKINNIVNRIEEGDLDKLVFSKTKTISPFAKENLSALFLSMEKNYKDAFVYLLNIPGRFSWCGASPEVLLSENNNDLHTVALAGTQKYNGEKLEDIKWEEKEILEQAFVCDHVESNITKAGYKYEKSVPKTARAAGVVHIKTEYSLRGEDGNFFDLARMLHPTPAVCGTPKDKALEMIDEMEGYDRSYYSGFLGPLGIRSERKLFVNLRCARLLNKKFSLFVGGGITKDSIPVKEWEETELKAATLIKLL